MQVSRYIAPFDQQNLISAIDDTSTDTLRTKSPRPMYGSSSRRKLSRVSGTTTNFTPYSSAIFPAAIVAGDDGDALFRNADVAQDERQRALADAAESDEDDAPWKLDVNLVVRHDLPRANQGERVSTIIRCCHPMDRSVSADLSGRRRRASAADKCARSPAATSTRCSQRPSAG